MSHTNGIICTVLTDASWCPDNKVAGWAAWIVCNDERVKKFDTFYGLIESSFEAEVKAILNGLWLAKNAFNTNHYHVVSDCVMAMDALQGKHNSKEWQNKMVDIVGTARVTFKHVKAHTNATDKRSWVNNWCDMQAKLSMRKLRTQVQGGLSEKQRPTGKA